MYARQEPFTGNPDALLQLAIAETGAQAIRGRMTSAILARKLANNEDEILILAEALGLGDEVVEAHRLGIPLQASTYQELHREVEKEVKVRWERSTHEEKESILRQVWGFFGPLKIAFDALLLTG